MKSAERLRNRLAKVELGKLYGTDTITRDEFDGWHKRNCLRLRDSGLHPVGWAAKLLNVYLKTLVYVGGYGRRDLVNWLHPPVDNILIKRLKEECARKDVSVPKSLDDWTRIKDVRTYDGYMTLIEDLRHLAPELDTCTAFELERFWRENPRA
jgi:hypothetical protein